MAKKKSVNYFQVNSIADADDALRHIADLKRQIDLVESDMNEKIDKIKASAEAETAEARKRIEMTEMGLELFAAEKKGDLFSIKRTIDLNFGSMGFRKSQELKPVKKMTWAKVLGRLKEFGFLEAIRKKESVDKEVLREWKEERLAEVGVTIQQKDTWWYEVNHMEIETV